MHPFISGFAGELLEKRAGLLKLVAKHPFAALSVGGTAAATIPAAVSGFRKGMRGEKERYLQASKYGPSESFYTNYHDALPHDLSAGERRELSYHYRPEAFGGK